MFLASKFIDKFIDVSVCSWRRNYICYSDLIRINCYSVKPISKTNSNHQAWKFGRSDCFVTASFPLLIKDSNDNLFPQIHLHNTNAFSEDLIGKHFYNLVYKLRFLHTYLPTLHKRACFSTTILPLFVYLECFPA